MYIYCKSKVRNISGHQEGHTMDNEVSPLYFFSKRITSILNIVAMICFISSLVSCAQVAQQKKEKAMSEDLLSASFPTEKEGWACGRWGTVLHTADSGKTWVLQRGGTENTLCSIHF